MNKTRTENLDLELPPQGGSLTAPPGSLADEAHALRVMLDRSENMKVAVGQTLMRLLETRFAGNRNALRDWYEAEVVEGKAHRAWNTVRMYLGVVITHGENASDVFAEREQAKRDSQRERDRDTRAHAAEFRRQLDTNDINNITESSRQPKSDYDRRADWLALMNYNWFKGEPEWQNKWLADRDLRRR